MIVKTERLYRLHTCKDCNLCKWRHLVIKFNPSHVVNFWVRCASGNFCLNRHSAGLLNIFTAAKTSLLIWIEILGYTAPFMFEFEFDCWAEESFFLWRVFWSYPSQPRVTLHCLASDLTVCFCIAPCGFVLHRVSTPPNGLGHQCWPHHREGNKRWPLMQMREK